MKFNNLHITKHAMSRWNQRIGNADAETIRRQVRTAKVTKCPMFTRKEDNMTYAELEGSILVFESISRLEFRLVTVLPNGA